MFYIFEIIIIYIIFYFQMADFLGNAIVYGTEALVAYEGDKHKEEIGDFVD